METYEFVAERQLIFHTEVGGIPRLIEFEEHTGNNMSLFQTQEDEVAAAIRRTAMFKRGWITETTKAPTSMRESANIDEETEEREEEEKTFSNITQAKDWVSRSWSIPKRALRKPEQIIKAAEEHGVRIAITAIEA